MKPELFRKKFFEGAPRYKWLETLGRGAVGIVYKALDLELDEDVAIKVLSPEMDRDEQSILARFKREIQLNRRIKHPNVARIYDYGMSGDYPFITMEFIPGKDLWTLIRQHGRLAPSDVIPILRQICRGCEAVHALGIVHRDLKSQNVIVDEKGAAVILDFGLARGKPNENFTLDSIMVGTPHYMSPEQASGHPVDARSDIYSAGIIAFEMLTGQLPFNASSPIAVAMKQINDPMPDLLSRYADISPELRSAVYKCVEKNPERRFPSAADFERELALLSPQTPKAPEEKAAEPPRLFAPPIVGSDDFLADLEMAVNSLGVPQGSWHQMRTPPAAKVEPERLRPVPLILVVNDDVRDLIKVATAVCEGGCRTLEVRNGPEALDALMRNSVDALLMDVELPGMDGFDVTRIIKAQPRFATLPILLMTDRPDRSHMAFAVQSGAADLLGRPMPPSQLNARLWMVLRRLGYMSPEQEAIRTSPRDSGARPRRKR